MNWLMYIVGIPVIVAFLFYYRFLVDRDKREEQKELVHAIRDELLPEIREDLKEAREEIREVREEILEVREEILEALEEIRLHSRK